MKIKCEIYRDSMQNYKKYAIPLLKNFKQMIPVVFDDLVVG